MNPVGLPTPTFTTYIPPTTPSLTTFTPAPTCYPTTVGEQMWHVTPWCYASPQDWHYPRLSNAQEPGCSYTKAGNPQEAKPECGDRWNGDPSVPIGSCPVGFTSAGLDDSYPKKPFDSTDYDWRNDITVTLASYDVTASHIICCPSIAGFDFKARTGATNNVYTSTQTYHDGIWWEVSAPMPHCYAHPVKALDGKTVTMGVWHDNRVYDKKRDLELQKEEKRQASPFIPGDQGKTVTAVFNAAHNTIWGEDYRYAYTVFHGTHTCYQNCHDYFTNSYYNTDPNYTPPPPATTSTSVRSNPSGEGGFPHPTDGLHPTGGGGGYPGGNGNGGGNGGGYPGGAVSGSSIRVGGVTLFSMMAAGFLGLTLAL